MKGQDILLALKLLITPKIESYADLGKSVGLSASEAHAAVRRLVEARLLEPESHRPIRRNLQRFLVHGLPFVFPACFRDLTRGTATAWAAPAFKNWLLSNDPPPVWPDPEGEERGLAVKPLYPSAVAAARNDPRLYELLALADILRLGRARERARAEQELARIIGTGEDSHD